MRYRSGQINYVYEYRNKIYITLSLTRTWNDLQPITYTGLWLANQTKTMSSLIKNTHTKSAVFAPAR